MNIHEPGFIEYQAREYGNHAVADMLIFQSFLRALIWNRQQEYNSRAICYTHMNKFAHKFTQGTGYVSVF